MKYLQTRCVVLSAFIDQVECRILNKREMGRSSLVAASKAKRSDSQNIALDPEDYTAVIFYGMDMV